MPPRSTRGRQRAASPAPPLLRPRRGFPDYGRGSGGGWLPVLATGFVPWLASPRPLPSVGRESVPGFRVGVRGSSPWGFGYRLEVATLRPASGLNPLRDFSVPLPAWIHSGISPSRFRPTSWNMHGYSFESVSIGRLTYLWVDWRIRPGSASSSWGFSSCRWLVRFRQLRCLLLCTGQSLSSLLFTGEGKEQRLDSLGLRLTRSLRSPSRPLPLCPWAWLFLPFPADWEWEAGECGNWLIGRNVCSSVWFNGGGRWQLLSMMPPPFLVACGPSLSFFTFPFPLGVTSHSWGRRHPVAPGGITVGMPQFV